MLEIYYENSIGAKLNLLKAPYRLQTANFFNYEWSYASSSAKKSNGKITEFSKTAFEREAVLGVLGKNKEDYYAAIDYFYSTVERDVVNLTPGKLWVGRHYLSCYIFASAKESWEDDIEVLDNTISIVSDHPYWCREEMYSFQKQQIISTSNKRYPGNYPYRYANGLNDSYIINPHFTDSNFKILIYGPVTNPQVIIGGASYLVYIVLEAGEYLEIDTRSETLTKVKQNGEFVNAFHNREKHRTFFQKIPPGRQAVSWTGEFSFDLTLYEERSEPRWSD